MTGQRKSSKPANGTEEVRHRPPGLWALDVCYRCHDRSREKIFCFVFPIDNAERELSTWKQMKSNLFLILAGNQDYG